MEHFLPLHRRRSLCSEAGSCWQPPVDVYRAGAGWICKFDLAGVGLDEIEVCVRERSLLVSGVRRDRYASEGLRAYSLEIVYSRFERAVRLPCDLDRAEITCEYRDGMLVVAVRPSAATP